MIRILQCVNVMDRAGLETMLMNYYRNVDRNVVQFDFLVHRDYKGAYDDEILSLGGKIIHAPRLYPRNYISYFKFVSNLIKNKEYKIIHSHIDAMSFFPLFVAKCCGVPIRIAHAHTSKLDYDLKFLIKYPCLKFLPLIANQYFACGEKAGRYFFKNRKFLVVRNAICLDKFKFDCTARGEIRDELSLSNKVVLGHVGRLCYIKNQLFLLEIYKHLKDKNNNFALVMIGEGEDFEKLTKKIKTDQIQDVSILPSKSDINRYYNLFDIFVMPSVFEGLPLVGIEAQANGLTCIFSESISEEVLITSNSYRCSLNDSSEKWADFVSGICMDRNFNSIRELRVANYDIKEEALKLQNIYLEFGRRCLS